MNAIILAGGEATRLWPVTESFPKALLRLAGKPVIYYLLKNLKSIHNINQVIISIEKKHEAIFNNCKDQYLVSGLGITLSAHTPRSNGSLKGPIEKINEIINNERSMNIRRDNYWILGADNVFGFELNDFYLFYEQQNATCNAVYLETSSMNPIQYGVAKLRNGIVKDFEEKPEQCIEISTACYIFKRDDIGKIDEYLSKNNIDTLGNFLGWLIPKSEIHAFEFSGKWFDIGTREGIISANCYLINKNFLNKKILGKGFRDGFTSGQTVYVGDSHIINQSIISSCVYIDECVNIDNSSVGPSVFIDHDVKIKNSYIRNTIIYNNCTIEDSEIDGCLIGQLSHIKQGKISDAIFSPSP